MVALHCYSLRERSMEPELETKWRSRGPIEPKVATHARKGPNYCIRYRLVTSYTLRYKRESGLPIAVNVIF